MPRIIFDADRCKGQEPDQPQGLSSRENHGSGALHRLRVLRRHVPRLRYHRGKVGKAYG